MWGFRGLGFRVGLGFRAHRFSVEGFGCGGLGD